MLPMIFSVLETDADRRLLASVYDRYHKRMERTAMRILRDRSDAEDAVQSAFMQVIRHFEKIFQIPCEDLPYWLISIVKNEAYMILRKRRGSVPLEEWDGQDLSELSDCGSVAELLSRLPDSYRQVLEMKVLLGYTDREIAQRLGISETAVSTRASRARRLFREILEKEGFSI